MLARSSSRSLSARRQESRAFCACGARSREARRPLEAPFAAFRAAPFAAAAAICRARTASGTSSSLSLPQSSPILPQPTLPEVN